LQGDDRRHPFEHGSSMHFPPYSCAHSLNASYQHEAKLLAPQYGRFWHICEVSECPLLRCYWSMSGPISDIARRPPLTQSGLGAVVLIYHSNSTTLALGGPF
jgi:hypothetical protein